MGTISKGILGGVSGKVGNIVGGSWKGIDYLRILPASVANPKTAKQINQRAKFMTVIKFLQPLTDFIRIGFKAYAIRMSAFNAAMSYNFKNAVIGVYPDYDIDYAKVLLSHGSLTAVYNASCATAGDKLVKLNWVNNTGNGTALAGDKVMVVIYNVLFQEVVYLIDAAIRSDGTAEVEVPASFTGKEVQCYLTFTALDELINTGGKKSISDSVYAGSMTVV